MARRVEASGGASNANTYPINITIVGINRGTLIFVHSLDTNLVTTLLLGAGNTIYDSGGDTSRRVINVEQDASNLEVFRILEADHPANGPIVVTVNTGASDSHSVGVVVQFSGAVQSTLFRLASQSQAVDADTPWDVTSIPNAAVDFETIGVTCARTGSNVHTPDPDNRQIIADSAGSGSGVTIAVVVDTTSRGTLGGDWSLPGDIVSWGASIIPVAAGTRVRRSVGPNF